MKGVKEQPDEESLRQERLAFTLYNILREFDRDQEGYLSIVRFNKVAFLIQKDIKERLEINAGIPWRWYLFGPTVELGYCPREVYRLKTVSNTEQRIFFSNPPVLRSLPKNEQDAILKVIIDWRNKYPKTKDSIDLAYSVIGVDFLEGIKRFEEYFLQIQKSKLDAPLLSKSVPEYLDKLINQYPEDLLGDILPLYLRIDDLLRLLSDLSPENLTQYTDVVLEMRKVVVKKASTILNDNLPESWLKNQIDDYAEAKKNLRIRCEEIEREVFSNVSFKIEDRTGYAKKLMEISWEASREG